ncbi:hypothetical protein SPI_05513 [Niveomyces insectorum RCEF 264]|uniref:Uncharacterized protein n=1 Tax=Niveomyces insectorum RCEF 264 TaxID=1081102 RepID=A0A167TAF8_9HYPO|nr:hypothetical protein SPI_05513 [Niveomyces insectorum RCEF 264]
MGLFSGFKRGTDKKKKLQKLGGRDTRPRRIPLDEEFSDDNSPSNGVKGRGHGRRDSSLSDTPRTGTPEDNLSPPPKLPAISPASLSALDVSSRPWTSGSVDVPARANSLTSASVVHTSFDTMLSSIQNERPSTANGPGPKPWGGRPSFEARFGSDRRPQTPSAALVSKQAVSSPQPGAGSAPARQAGTHKAQSSSDIGGSTSSAQTDHSGTAEPTTSPLSTVSGRSPPQPPPIVAGDGKDLHQVSLTGSRPPGSVAMFDASKTRAPRAPIGGPRLFAEPTVPLALVVPTSRGNAASTGSSPGPSATKAKDVAKKKDLAISIPRRRSWSAEIDQLEQSWLQEQLSPSIRAAERPRQPNEHPYPPYQDGNQRQNNSPRLQQPYTPQYSPHPQAQRQSPRQSQQHATRDDRNGVYSPEHPHNHHTADARSKRYGKVGDLPAFSPTGEWSPDLPRDARGSDRGTSNGHTIHEYPPRRLRGSKSLQHLQGRPLDPNDVRHPRNLHHDQRRPREQRGPREDRPPRSSRERTYSPHNYGSPVHPTRLRSPPSTSRHHSPSTPRRDSRYPEEGQASRTRWPPPPSPGMQSPTVHSPTGYRNDMYAPLDSPGAVSLYSPEGGPGYASGGFSSGYFDGSPSDRYQGPFSESSPPYRPVDSVGTGGYRSFSSPSNERRPSLPGPRWQRTPPAASPTTPVDRWPRHEGAPGTTRSTPTGVPLQSPAPARAKPPPLLASAQLNSMILDNFPFPSPPTPGSVNQSLLDSDMRLTPVSHVNSNEDPSAALSILTLDSSHDRTTDAAAAPPPPPNTDTAVPDILEQYTVESERQSTHPSDHHSGVDGEPRPDPETSAVYHSQDDNDNSHANAVEPESLPPLSPISMPAGDALPSSTANWPLPSFPTPVADQSPPTTLQVSPPATPAALAPTDASPEDFEKMPSPMRAKAAFTASVYAREIGDGPYAFDAVESPRLDAYNNNPSMPGKAAANTSEAMRAPTTASKGTPRVEQYGAGGLLEEPLSPESIGVARGLSIIASESLTAESRRWNEENHYCEGESDRGHEDFDAPVDGSLNLGGKDYGLAGHGGAFVRRPPGMVDNFGTGFI